MNPEMQGEVQDVIVSGIENNSAQRLNVEVNLLLHPVFNLLGCCQIY